MDVTGSRGEREPHVVDGGPPRGTRSLAADIAAVLAAAALVVAAALVGWALLRGGEDIFLFFPPLLASWMPHTGPGTVPAVLVALLVVIYGPGAAARLPWRPLLACGYTAALAWTVSLALVDGYRRGIADRLTDRTEYLHDVPLAHGIVGTLRHFTEHILIDQPQHWTTQVGAHPPGAFLIYLLLDRIGLGGGGPAGLITLATGASAGVAVAVALRALGAEHIARTSLPFGVLLPGAVWVGVSADGLFAAVTAWGLALLAIGTATPGVTARRGRKIVAALAGGALLGYTLYLSYGLTLAGLLAAAVLAVTRRPGPTLLAIGAAAVVVAGFTVAGFAWWEGFHDLRIIYAESAAQHRPYWYFVWADLAAFCFAIGPAGIAGLRRFLATPRRLPVAAAALVGAAVLAVIAADLSGFSKGEVERIWLPFAVWLTVPCALLEGRRAPGWLAAQAMLALLVNHLLLTPW